MIGNSLWMVIGAIEWFFNIPADMPATDDPNGHLIRDVGFAYTVSGFAVNCCALRLQSQCLGRIAAIFPEFHQY